MKIDLHCHSKHSKRPTLWIMQKLNCPESFTEPLALYRQARERGMGWVTITDHNVIDGALEIADLPNTVIGCEYTTYFPEDRCKVHVLVYGMTEAQHRDITEARENIFDFTRYIQDQKLRHACAHPLFWINDRLTLDHIEKLLLLYKNWEWNGDMVKEMNEAMLGLLGTLTPLKIAELADKHGIEPAFDEPWKKNITAGSDDHGSLHLTRTYTEVPGAQSWDEFWLGVEHGKAKVRSQPATPEMFARNVYGIGYQFYNSKFGLDRYRHNDALLRFLDRTLKADTAGADPWISRVQLMLTRRFRGSAEISPNSSLFEMARVEAEKLIQSDPQLVRIMQKGSGNGADLDQTWAEFVSEVSNRLLAHIGHHTLDRLRHARLFDLFHSAGSSAALYTLIAPFFVSYSLFAKERQWSRQVWRHFAGTDEGNPAARPRRVAHFTDTFDEVNGVALTLQQELDAAQRAGRDLTVITCASGDRPFRAGVHCVPALTSYALPDYPELAINVPPFLKLLKHCYDEGYTHVHVATPGAMGLVGLAVARILHLPITGTYHTAFPQYAKTLTEDGYVESLMWTGITWFYQQLDAVYVPSRATGAELVVRGLHASKIRLFPRGVDTEFFNSCKRSDALRGQLGATRDTTMLLYVGRVSKEKNLGVLTDAMHEVTARGHDPLLVVVGDGPYRKEMEEKLAGRRAVFTGYKCGDDLAELFASADLFVFPSTTDTFGNVVLEAQASGLPVIATNIGGPQENIEPDETGVIVNEISGAAFANAIEPLARDSERRRRMGEHARRAMESRNIDASFARLWQMYQDDETGRAEPASSLFDAVANLVDPAIVTM